MNQIEIITIPVSELESIIERKLFKILSELKIKQDEWLTAEEAMTELKCKRTKLHELINEKKLKTKGTGRSRRISQKSIIKHLENL